MNNLLFIILLLLASAGQCPPRLGIPATHQRVQPSSLNTHIIRELGAILANVQSSRSTAPTLRNDDKQSYSGVPWAVESPQCQRGKEHRVDMKLEL